MTEASDRLASARSKIEWAKKHIADLDVALRMFYNTKPYKVGTKRDPRTRKLIYYVVGVNPTPDHIPLITADVLQNLRSALDHLAYQLFLIRPGSATSPGRHIYFPITENAAKYKTESPGKVKGMRQDAIKAIDAIEPYGGGKGHQLWLLHKLNLTDKHRLLITVGSAFRSVNLGAHMWQGMQRHLDNLPEGNPMRGRVLPVIDAYFRGGDRMCPLRVGDEFLIGAPDEEANEKMDFRFEVAFNEPQIAESDPLIETVQQFAKLVGDIVTTFIPLL
jgi:hypothetical protein